MSGTLKVDVWSDIACPFCYFGKRKFEAGVAASGIAVEIEYHSFELSPETPDEVTGSHAEKIAEKLRVSLTEALAMEARITETARSEGLEFDYERMIPANTRNAHRLLHHAKAHGVQREMKERLMRAYFTEGRHIGDVTELAALAGDVGLDADETQRTLRAGAYEDAVDADIERAASLGIRGVPFFVIDGRYGISGAQEPATFADALIKASTEREAL